MSSTVEALHLEDTLELKEGQEVYYQPTEAKCYEGSSGEFKRGIIGPGIRIQKNRQVQYLHYEILNDGFVLRSQIWLSRKEAIEALYKFTKFNGVLPDITIRQAMYLCKNHAHNVALSISEADVKGFLASENLPAESHPSITDLLVKFASQTIRDRIVDAAPANVHAASWHSLALKPAE